MIPQSALNGYFERVRRLFRLVGVSDVPAGITPVVIAGDTREVGNPTAAYRRFAFSNLVTAGPVAADTTQKLQFDVDVAITRVRSSHQSSATAAVEFRLMTVADVTADVAATYATPTSAQAAWTDRPESGPPPLRLAANGSVGVGRLIYGTPFAAGQWEFDSPIFLPRGAALYLRANANGITNWRVSVEGYQTSEKGS